MQERARAIAIPFEEKTIPVQEQFSTTHAIKKLLSGSNPKEVFGPLERNIRGTDISTSHTVEGGGIKKVVNTMITALSIDVAHELYRSPVNDSLHNNFPKRVTPRTPISRTVWQVLFQNFYSDMLNDTRKAVTSVRNNKDTRLLHAQVFSAIKPVLSDGLAKNPSRARRLVGNRIADQIETAEEALPSYFQTVATIYELQHDEFPELKGKPLTVTYFLELLEESIPLLLTPTSRDVIYFNTFRYLGIIHHRLLTQKQTPPLNELLVLVKNNKGKFQVKIRPEGKTKIEGVYAKLPGTNPTVVTGCPAGKDDSVTDEGGGGLIRTMVTRMVRNIEAPLLAA